MYKMNLNICLRWCLVLQIKGKMTLEMNKKALPRPRRSWSGSTQPSSEQLRTSRKKQSLKEVFDDLCLFAWLNSSLWSLFTLCFRRTVIRILIKALSTTLHEVQLFTEVFTYGKFTWKKSYYGINCELHCNLVVTYWIA